MITCFIRYHIDPTKMDHFVRYAQNWGRAIPRCGGDFIGTTHRMKAPQPWRTGVYTLESLAASAAYRDRVAADPPGRGHYEFALRETVLLREDRTFLKPVSAPHARLEAS